jgi:hypothetical protein
MKFRETSVAPLLCLMTGCFPAPMPKPSLTDPDPTAKIPAIRLSVQNKDMTATKSLVKDLNSDDPAVRFYAIEGLRKLTNEDYGYHYYDDQDQRAEAIKRWEAWVAGWEAGSGEK